MRSFFPLAIVVIAVSMILFGISRQRGPQTAPLSSLSRTKTAPTAQRLEELSRRAKLDQVSDEAKQYFMAVSLQPVELARANELKSFKPMPPTACNLAGIQSAKHPNIPAKLKNAATFHGGQVVSFESRSGFGIYRMAMPFHNSDMERVELVSLLTETEPSVYVADSAVTPAEAKLTMRRPLDEFEVHGLQRLRAGDDLVWSPENPLRLMGAVRAHDNCIQCHIEAKPSDLLGAFTYYLNVPVNQL